MANYFKKHREKGPKGPNRNTPQLKKRTMEKCSWMQERFVTRGTFLRIMLPFNKKHRGFYDNSFTGDLSGNSVVKSKKQKEPSENYS